MKFILLVFFSLISLGCNATSCVMSEKYRNHVHIEVTKNNSLLTFFLYAPDEIEGKNLVNVVLYKEINKLSTNEYSIPLRFTIDDGKAVSWFEIDEKTASHNFLSLDYGEECGTSIRYKLLN